MQSKFSSSGMEGNFIRWSNVKWDFVRMVSDEMSTNDFCRPPKPVNLMFPGKRDFPSVISMCKKFHGNVTVMKDKGLSDEIGGQWWGKIEPMGVNPDGMLQFLLFILYINLFNLSWLSSVQLVCGLE